MQNFISLFFSLLVSAASFSQIIELGPKEQFLHAPKLEPLELFCEAGFSCYPSDNFPKDKKLVIGLSSNPSMVNEYLYIIENNEDAQKFLRCGQDYRSFYLLDSEIVVRF